MATATPATRAKQVLKAREAVEASVALGSPWEDDARERRHLKRIARIFMRGYGRGREAEINRIVDAVREGA